MMMRVSFSHAPIQDREERTMQVEDFFEEYEEIFNHAIQDKSADIEKTAKCFADSFIEANPHGVNCGRSDERFRAGIQKGYAFYRQIGITSMDILSKSVTFIDEIHAMTKIRWRSNFVRKDLSTDSIEFDVHYFTQLRNDQIKIFAYITGDEHQALTEHGLL